MSVQQDEIKRRRALRQKRIRRRRIFIALIVFLVLALITGVVLCFTVLFPVRIINAGGSAVYTPEQIQQACGITEKNNILTFSSSKVTEKLQKSLPYIEEVEIERKLPDTVVITVKDAEEFACYPVDGEYYTVSRLGRVLNCYNDCPEGMFTVRTTGVNCVLGEMLDFEKENTKNTVESLLNGLTDLDIEINEIDVTNPLELTAKVEGRFIVNFGTSGSLKNKIAHLGGMVTAMNEGQTGYINLSMWTSDKTEGTFTSRAIE